ncbi:hypothetical protein [Fulvivirga ligni]|uniref:hypothetical protein n=1 Tax=Fulvivirga ligni TaxID=2904246 RepID=UPI001F3D9047|nr:hypothetical protein [Fulvivirga ligni]UII20606.1 hypothetical protein LVD16_22450 [Fulvivirga ligni]
MRILIFAITFLLITLSAEAKKIEGKIIYEDHTEEVVFDVPMRSGSIKYIKIQSGITYFDHENNEKVVLPQDAKEIRFNYKGDAIVLISFNTEHENGGHYLINHNEPYSFVHRKQNGKLKLYDHESYLQHESRYSNNNSGKTLELNLYMQVGDGPLKYVMKRGFDRFISRILKDCPEVVELVNNKHFKRKHLEEIVDYYNSHCGD